MTHIQGTRGNSSLAYTKISFENNMCKYLPEEVNTVQAGHLELWWHQVFYVTADDVSSICIYK